MVLHCSPKFFRDGFGAGLLLLATWATGSVLGQVETQYLAGQGSQVSVSAERLLLGGRNGARLFTLGDAGWELEASLAAEGSEALGGAADIDGTTVILGDEQDNEACGGGECYGSGAAYIFEYDGIEWIQRARFVTSPPFGEDAEYDHFGAAVAVTGEWAVVGAPRDGIGGTWSGSVTFFRRTTDGWGEYQRITGDPWSTFGSSIAAENGRVFVRSGSEADSRVFVYRFDGAEWVEVAELIPSVGGLLGFGYDIYARTDDVAVSAMHYANPDGSRVFVFSLEGGEWVESAMVMGPSPRVDDRFGTSVALGDEWLAVGDWCAGPGSHCSGSAYLFEQEGAAWVQTARVQGGAAGYYSWFGTDLAVSAGRLIVSAKGDNDAYVFDPHSTLPIPPLQHPAEDVVFAPNEPVTFQWSEVPGAVGYRIQVWKDSGGQNGSMLVNEGGLSDNVFTTSIPNPHPSVRQVAWRVNATFEEGTGAYADPRSFMVTGTPVEVEGEPLIGNLTAQVFPNPLRAFATLEVTLAVPTMLDIRVFDVYGRMVAVVEGNTPYSAGDHSLTWDARGVPSGAYLVRVRSGSASRVVKVAVLH